MPDQAPAPASSRAEIGQNPNKAAHPAETADMPGSTRRPAEESTVVSSSISHKSERRLALLILRTRSMEFKLIPAAERFSGREGMGELGISFVNKLNTLNRIHFRLVCRHFCRERT